MTLLQLKYLIEVADKGSMNKAAKSLYIAQPSLSSAIGELEKEINITIFVRTSKGVTLSDEGAEFLGYARQVVKHAEILEDKFIAEKPAKQEFAVSTQHFAAGVLAFSELIRAHGSQVYEFKLRETRVQDIIEDVKSGRSEVGIMYLNHINENAVKRRLQENNLEFTELFRAAPQILVGAKSPLAKKEKVTLDDLLDYPCVSFEHDESNIFFFCDEILSTVIHKKNVKVSERATLYTMISELNGYTISTGIISDRLRRTGITPIRLEVDSFVKVGTITGRGRPKSDLCVHFMNILQRNADGVL